MKPNSHSPGISPGTPRPHCPPPIFRSFLSSKTFKGSLWSTGKKKKKNRTVRAGQFQLTESLQHARFFRHSLKSSQQPQEEELQSPFYRCGHGGSERCNDLPRSCSQGQKEAELVGHKIFLTQRPLLSYRVRACFPWRNQLFQAGWLPCPAP